MPTGDAADVQILVPEHSRPIKIGVDVQAAWEQHVQIWVDGNLLPPIHGSNGGACAQEDFRPYCPTGESQVHGLRHAW